MSMKSDDRTRISLLRAAGDAANHEAREAFAECYGGLIRDWCRGRGLQDADQEDVAQTIVCELLEKLPTFKYDPKQRFRGLLNTMVRHAIADLYRAGIRRPGDRGSGDTGVRGLLDMVPAPDDTAVTELARKLARQMARDQRIHVACQRVRRRVEPHTWQAFWLTTVEGKPVAVVAERLGMTKGAVPVAKLRVTRMIRSEVEGQAGCEGRSAANP